jgi:phenylalanyl-tRNA synthetase beta chain
MKFSEKWLREWVDPAVSIEELVEQLTMAGLEVDSVEPAGAGLESLLVGEVISVDKHPDADKLRVCQVNIGQQQPLQIVCGAPNVSAGGKYPLAPVGGRMPGGKKIKKSKLRGVESQGMLCSSQELELSEDHDGLMELPAEALAGQSLRDFLGLDDNIIDLDLTPNRGDCLGIEGIAREVGTLLRSAVTTVAVSPVKASIDDRFEIDIQTPAACPQYLGRVIRGVDATVATPLWMKERLRRSGLRSLGPVVDVTNYVLLELGQPMHAFDLARLSGGVRVRYALEGEELTLLDDRTVALNAGTVVIADHDKPLAIAGVMGGLDSGVKDTTTDLFLECAFFLPEMIAGCARSYGMHTDSAHRFERGVDPALQQRAIERATELLLAISGGEAGPVCTVTSSEHLPVCKPLVLRRERIQRVLGMSPEDGEVADILGRLGMVATEQQDGWLVEPPGFRFDIRIEADLIEEIGRIYGYNRLPSVSLQGAMEVQAVPETDITLMDFCDVLIARGYQEAITYSFVDEVMQAQINPDMVPVRLANPISSEMAEMRTSLWTGLLKAVQHNVHRQKTRLRFFEHGLRFYTKDDGAIQQDVMFAGVITGSRFPESWDGKEQPVDFYDLKNDLETLLQLGGDTQRFTFSSREHPALHPGQTAAVECAGKTVGWLGCIHPVLAKRLDLSSDTCLFEVQYDSINTSQLTEFKLISRYPSIRRDLAFVVDADLQTGVLQAAVKAVAGGLLKQMPIFDVYQGKGIESGLKSIAFGLILQDNSRTLTEQDIEAVVEKVTMQLGDKFGATLRD